MRIVVVFAALAGVLVGASAAGGAGNPLIPTPIGAGPRFHPPALSPEVAAGRPLGALRCATSAGRRFGAHLELYARGRVVVVPAGIGIARPWTSPHPQLVSGRCSYPARTRTAGGVIEVEVGRTLTLGHFFALWGQPLGPRRLAGFATSETRPVRAYVGGRRWCGSLAAIPLRRHAEIVLELGEYIPPHVTFLFARGL